MTDRAPEPLPLPDAPARQVAVIDVGARAIRLDVAEIGADGRIVLLESLQRAVSLGKDTFTEGRIEPASIEECVEILRGFRTVAAEYGIRSTASIRAVATSSVREASNRDAFLDRLYIATGISVELLEDPEVEHLIYMALHDLSEREARLREGQVIILEVGGGTTRVLLFQDGHVVYSGSFRLGALRMREALETYATPTERLETMLDQHIQRTIVQMRQSVPATRVPQLVALAGDMHAAMTRLLPNWDPDRQTARLEPGALAVGRKILSTPVDRLMRRYKLPHQEAETAAQALLIIEHVAKAFNVEQVLVTATSLRRGLLVSMAGTESGTARFADQLVHSALTLGTKYHFDRQHAMNVMDLSVQIFQALQPEHGLGPREEALLRGAAILHDIGAFVSNASHHKHSMYLILNSEVFGLTRRDNNTVALIARYHRRALPQPTHAEYAQLDRESRVVVQKLAAILRVADALDRSHLQHIRTLQCAREGRQFVMTAVDLDDVTLERAALGEKADLFQTVFGLDVVLKAKPLPGGSLFNG